jgi:hypothetical protein
MTGDFRLYFFRAEGSRRPADHQRDDLRERML